MHTHMDCTLKADNYATAARLDCSGRRLQLARMAASWRVRGLKAMARDAGIFISDQDHDSGLWVSPN